MPTFTNRARQTESGQPTPGSNFRFYLGWAAVVSLIALAHLGGYLLYGTLRGFGEHATQSEEWVQRFTLFGLLVHVLLGRNAERPRWETRKSVLAGEVAIVGCCWIFLWASPDWTASSARAYMIGSGTATFVAMAAYLGIVNMRSYVAAVKAREAVRRRGF